MKKTILAVVALLCLCGTAAAQRHIEYKWRGFYSVVDLSYVMNLNRAPGFNNQADTLSGIAMGFSGGFQFRKEASLGAGITYMYDPAGAFTQMPVYVELRSHFMRSRLTPYAAAQAGYSLPLGASSPEIKITKGGLYFAAELGARFAVDRGFAIGAHVGYKLLNMNQLERTDEYGFPRLSDPVALHLISAGMTLHF